jgi:hypothetical protein
MTVKELTQLLSSCNPDADVVIRDHSLDESNTEGNGYVALDIQEGFFDAETGSFNSADEIDSNDNEVFGSDSVAICMERL